MRLWHYKLIKKLPRQQLLGQHREATALRGLGWGKKHSTVNYVFEHSYSMLYFYHVLVMAEMKRRKYNVSEEWYNPKYRGKRLGYDDSKFTDMSFSSSIYPEHDDAYYEECILNLKDKGITID